jgi:DNA (cytosine-5)-methyltransferase 1
VPPAIAYGIQAGALRENPDSGPDGVGVQEGRAYTLEARAEVQAVAFALGSHAGAADGDQTNRSHAGGGPVGLGVQAECAYSLRAGRTQAVGTPWAVRRLSPTECERLMGFEGGWTKIPYRNKPADACPDGPRYKALGNSWAVNCGEWVFDRLRMVEERWNAERLEAAE